ncbi:hypothetical protein [uncultured Nocardioides sp.]|uniref:hypothetical protein n=1 Tax=uncultured Nocardioides sp. TaxID=198441 RepID=UPI000C672459|nr:hypothetical protein [Nocardioides sp.]|tara:strand:+ start:863 stop:1234 length:372 start_codon:yes stop_codon:yes gene_type:complete
MKKLIVAILAGFMLSFVGAPALAAYEPTTDTDVKPKVKKGEPKPGKKKRIVVKPRVQGDTGQCTGSIKIIYKANKKVARQRTKPVDNRVKFNGRVPAGTTKIVVLYQRGKKDPCDKSKSVIRL